MTVPLKRRISRVRHSDVKSQLTNVPVTEQETQATTNVTFRYVCTYVHMLRLLLESIINSCSVAHQFAVGIRTPCWVAGDL